MADKVKVAVQQSQCQEVDSPSIYKRRKETIERSFTAKQQQGLGNPEVIFGQGRM